MKGSVYRMYREQCQAKANPSLTHARRLGMCSERLLASSPLSRRSVLLRAAWGKWTAKRLKSAHNNCFVF